MDLEPFAEWLSGLSLQARISALSVIYLRLTVNARELFLPDRTLGKEQRVEEILHGLNEIHHTLANQLIAYTTDADKASPVQVLSRMLQDIESKYHLRDYLTSAVELARSQGSASPLTVYPDGTVADGNTRIRILIERGVDVDSLPRLERIPGI
ncbi:MAG TPA: hypothetical protein VFR24_02765 [Candidatus Angelobacter sp.]|nr:hypothetical protein [Candidatus Angelobacter sp.]